MPSHMEKWSKCQNNFNNKIKTREGGIDDVCNDDEEDGTYHHLNA